MKYFRRLNEIFPTDLALTQLERRPDLWDRDPQRTTASNSPHRQSSDIWLRFRPRSELSTPETYGEPHFAAFWPAWDELPALRPIVFRVMSLVDAVYLGGILLTRIPAGCEIFPHVDRGWHPEFLNRKVYVIIKANERCLNHCMDETVTMRPGEAWLFDNGVTHSVENRGDDERIAMIVTMRSE
jgi:hypothetical protein